MRPVSGRLLRTRKVDSELASKMNEGPVAELFEVMGEVVVCFGPKKKKDCGSMSEGPGCVRA